MAIPIYTVLPYCVIIDHVSQCKCIQSYIRNLHIVCVCVRVRVTMSTKEGQYTHTPQVR